jgi:hypothetical protein
LSNMRQGMLNFLLDNKFNFILKEKKISSLEPSWKGTDLWKGDMQA